MTGNKQEKTNFERFSDTRDKKSIQRTTEGFKKKEIPITRLQGNFSVSGDH